MDADREDCPVALMAARAEAFGRLLDSLKGRGRADYATVAMRDPHMDYPPCVVGVPSRPGGKAAQRMMPLPDLAAAGWRVVAVPMMIQLVHGGGYSLNWGREWLVIPPETSSEAPQRFHGRGLAQLWATERCQPDARS